MTQTSSKVLLIGKPGTSKSTFLDQFYGLVELGLSCAQLRATPASLTAIEKGRARLAQGQEVEATPSAELSKILLQLDVDGRDVDLDLLDYGGEQVRDIIDNRQLPAHWLQLATECDTWLLFLRVHDQREPDDVTVRSVAEAANGPVAGNQAAETNVRPAQLNEAVSLIELLQMLLAARKTGYQPLIKVPQLKLVISLWDMLHEPGTPEEELRKRHPLLVQFLRSNWTPAAGSVWGLSPQGFSLDLLENQEKYLLNGSEQYAQVILPSGESRNDLALLLL